MKQYGSIFALFLMFFAVSCDNGLKFNNPNDKNSDAYQGGDADSERADDDAERPAGREQGELYGECYSDNTCNEGLECDVLNNICKKDSGDSGDTTPDGDSGDTGDTMPDGDSGDTGDTGDTTPDGDSGDTGDTGDTTPDGDSGDSGDSGDTTPDGDSGDSGDTTPDGDSGDSGDTTPDGDSGDSGDTIPADTLTLGNICTGQNKCYNNSSEETTCPFSSSAEFLGQDAQYRSKCTAQSFSSSSNVVEDNNTGLTWEKSPSSSSYTWDNRATHCNELNSSNYGGRSDWRVPTSLEILTIVDNQKYASAVNSIFSGIPGSGSFWTAEQYSSDQGRRFGTNTGFIGYNSKTGTYNKVLCVSGDEMQKGVFTTQTVSGSVVVTDSTTGLMWQKTYETDKTWQQALKYCEDLTYAGYSDWRLPNKNELASLLNLDKSAAPYSDFPNMPSDWFWSSSTYILYTDNAWDVGFYYGLVGYYYKTKSHSVRCVRNTGDSGDIGDSGDSGDSGDTTPPDTGDTEPTEEEICAEAGGTYDYFADDELTKCYKIVECDQKPANTEWRGEQSYTEYYDLEEGYWTHFGLNYSTEYGDTGEAKVCQYICALGFDWNGFACTNGGYLNLGNICTGQTNCYNASSSITCPSSSSADFFGQDAYYASIGKCTAQSFTVQTLSSQKVVLDNNTGLMWQQTAPSTTYAWEDAKSYCSSLIYAGYSDWRVPNSLELLTIVDNSTYDPATNFNFTGMPTSDVTYLWTNNEYKGNTSYAYVFSPSYGYYYVIADSDCSKTKTYKVLCVSGEEMKSAVSSDFTISSDGKTVTDNRTGLMWQKTHVTGKTLQQALKYCEDLSYAGYTDWRLPNKNEAASLLNYNKSAVPYSDFPDMPSSCFWSSSTNVNYTSSAWDVCFSDGDVNVSNKSINYYVRCVR